MPRGTQSLAPRGSRSWCKGAFTERVLIAPGAARHPFTHSARVAPTLFPAALVFHHWRGLPPSPPWLRRGYRGVHRSKLLVYVLCYIYIYWPGVGYICAQFYSTHVVLCKAWQRDESNQMGPYLPMTLMCNIRDIPRK